VVDGGDVETSSGDVGSDQHTVGGGCEAAMRRQSGQPLVFWSRLNIQCIRTDRDSSTAAFAAIASAMGRWEPSTVQITV
jgi:hypothetical protein